MTTPLLEPSFPDITDTFLIDNKDMIKEILAGFHSLVNRKATINDISNMDGAEVIMPVYDLYENFKLRSVDPAIFSQYTRNSAAYNTNRISRAVNAVQTNRNRRYQNTYGNSNSNSNSNSNTNIAPLNVNTNSENEVGEFVNNTNIVNNTNTNGNIQPHISNNNNPTNDIVGGKYKMKKTHKKSRKSHKMRKSNKKGRK